MPYFIISCSPDGDVSVRQYDKARALEIMREMGSYGDSAASDIPDPNPVYWPDQYVVVKGEIVCPHSVRVVLELDID